MTLETLATIPKLTSGEMSRTGATRLPAATRDADDQVGTKDAMKRKAEKTAAIHNARRRPTRQQKKILQLEEAAE